MSPTSYRTAPPRVIDWNTNRNTGPERRSSASGAWHEAAPHNRCRELTRQAVRNRPKLPDRDHLERFERERTLRNEPLEPTHGHLVQSAFENRARAVGLER